MPTTRFFYNPQANANVEGSQPATTEGSETTQPSGAGETPATQSSENAESAPDESVHMTGDLFGERSKLENRGVTLDLNLVTDFGDNFTGGAVTSHGGAAYEFNFSVAIDTKKLLGWDGGTFFTNFRAQEGLTHSLDGSFGSTSHLYGPRRLQLSEIWYQQSLFDDKLHIKAGKIDANGDFDNTVNGADFLNDFASYSATLLGFPTDPDPAFGADVFIYPNDNFYAGFGIFDGSLIDGVATGSYGPASLFNGSASYFLIGEAGAKWTLSNARSGRLGIGFWDHTGTIQHLDDSGSDRSVIGPYLSFDQTLWKKNPDQSDDNRGIGLFVLAGYANPRVSSVDYQASGGLAWTGPVPSRVNDVLGLGLGFLHFSNATNAGFDEAAETTLELFYRIQVTPWMNVQPDLQYIHDPGGISSQHDAVAGTVQMVIDFRK